MRILVAITNFGWKNMDHLAKLIKEYNSMSYHVDIVVFSNVPKDLGPDVEVRVGLPTRNPWSLPFGWKDLFKERRDNYDVFIYSEDDTLITQSHVEAFFRSSEELPEDKIAGFLRYEVDSEGNKFCSTIHSPRSSSLA